MSYSRWSEPGYGFKLWNGSNGKDIVNFIAEHKSDFLSREEADEICEEIEKNGYTDFFEDEPASYIVSEIINTLENATMFSGYRACGDTDQEEMIGISPMYPWFMNQGDYVTKEMADEALKKYGKMLGITEKPDYFDAQYGG